MAKRKKRSAEEIELIFVKSINEQQKIVIQSLRQRITVFEADEAGLRETIGHLNKALEALNGVTP